MSYKNILLAPCLAAMIIAVPAGLRADSDNAILIPRKCKTSQTTCRRWKSRLRE